MGELKDRMMARKARAEDRMKAFIETHPDEYFKNLNKPDTISRDELAQCVLSWNEKTNIDMSYSEYIRLKKWAEDYIREKKGYNMDAFYKKCEICSVLIRLDEKEKIADAIKPRICDKCAALQQQAGKLPQNKS